MFGRFDKKRVDKLNKQDILIHIHFLFFFSKLEVFMNINDVMLKGNLTADPEVRNIEVKGKPTSVCNVTLAVTRRFPLQNNEWGEETVFVPCEVWDTGAISLGEKCVKGDLLLVRGILKSERWEVEGQKRSRLKVRVSKFELIPRVKRD